MILYLAVITLFFSFRSILFIGCDLDCSWFGTIGGNCNKTTGQCDCKELFEGEQCDTCRLPHVTGVNCDVCEDGYWGFDNETGCKSNITLSD